MAGCAVVFGLLVPGWEEQPVTTWQATPTGQDQAANGASADAADGANPSTGTPPWIWLGLILIVTILLVGWGWTNLPVRIDLELHAAGWEAQALLAGTGSGWLARAPQALGYRRLPAHWQHLSLATASLAPISSGCWRRW